MEQSLYDLLRNVGEQAAKALNKMLEEKSLYDLLEDARKKGSKEAVSINRKYAKIFTGNSVKYCINPEYLKVKNVNRLKRVVYSIIQNAFKEYKHGEKENIEILSNYSYQAEKIKGIKKELEGSYGFRGTDAGFYEVPVLGKALDFSVENLSVKAVRPDSLKEYI